MFVNNQEANELRKKGDFEAALNEYNQLKDRDIFTVSGMSYCYRKLNKSEEAVKVLNKFIKENQVDVKQEKWLKSEVIWSFTQYYLDGKYKKKDLAIKAANRILELENGNEIILKKIKKNLCTDEIIKKYPFELLEILEKIEDGKLQYNKTKSKIKRHLLEDNNVNTCVYYTLILSKLKILLELQEYDEILDICSIFKNIIDDRHIERYKAKALEGLEKFEEAIDILEKINIRFGKQYYIYTDIGDIYKKIDNIEKALEFYYKAMDLCNEDKFLLTNLLKVGNLLLEKDVELAKKHIYFEILIREKEGWKIHNNELELLDKLGGIDSTQDYEKLRKELKKLWRDKVNLGKINYEGSVVKVFDNGNGFINFDGDKRIFFKRNKRINFTVGDIVTFYIEDSYDRKKEEYSQAATQIRYKK